MTNVYFGLQTGWVSMMSLQSALLGFAIFKAIPRVLPRLKIKPFTPQENVILQTVAVATGTMPLAAGLVGIIPALEMMSETMDGRGPVVLGAAGLIMWCMAVAFFGYVERQGDDETSRTARAELGDSVFLAAPLRRQVVSNTPARPVMTKAYSRRSSRRSSSSLLEVRSSSLPSFSSISSFSS
jgi:uncharacterized oligopeptide transporter (OPT) family protein